MQPQKALQESEETVKQLKKRMVRQQAEHKQTVSEMRERMKKKKEMKRRVRRTKEQDDRQAEKRVIGVVKRI